MSDVVANIGNDAALLGKLHGSNAGTALGEIAQRYAGMVYGTCLRVTGDAQAAADATQETFFELLRRSQGVHGSLAGWLHAVARRRSIDMVRRDETRRRYETAYATTPREVSQWSELSPLVDEALEGLRPEAREMLVRHYLAGESTVALAAALGVSQPTISRRVSGALEELREKLRKMGVLAAGPALMGMMPAARGVVPAMVAQELGKMALTASAGVGGGLAAGLSWTMKAVAAVVLAAVAGFAGYEIMKPAAAVPQGAGIGAAVSQDPGMATAAEDPQVTGGDLVAGLPPGVGEDPRVVGVGGPYFGGMVMRAPDDGVDPMQSRNGDGGEIERMGGMGGFGVAMGGVNSPVNPEWRSDAADRGAEVADAAPVMGEMVLVAAPRVGGARGDTAEAAGAVRPAGAGAAPAGASRPLPEILRDLGNQAYAVRERAQAELAKVPVEQLNALRNAEKGTRDAEVKARLGKRIVELERDAAREVLARFAETQNKLAAMSYRAFSTTEWVMGGPKKMLYYRSEVRFDADLADRRQWHWGDLPGPPTGALPGDVPEPWPTFGEERAEYRHHFWVGTEMLQFYRFDDPMWWRNYGGQGDPRQGFVRIQGTGDAAPPRQCQAMAVHAGPLFGYLGGLNNRCDVLLGDAAELKLRQATELVGGMPCQVIEARQKDRFGSDWRYTLWFDPAHGYNLARIDDWAGPGKNGNTGEYHLVRVEFARHGDLWLPAKADMTYTDVMPGRATSRDKVHLEITDVRVGAESGGWQKTALADIPDGVPVTPGYAMKVRTPGTWQGGKVVDESGNVFFDAAVGSTVPTPGAGATKPAARMPERVLEFPAGRSLGQLSIQDETYQRTISGFSTYSDEMEHATFLAQATGTVKVPAGKRVRLTVWANGSPDLSALAKLDPDALYSLSLPGYTLSDQALEAVAHLMGLRELDLHRSTVSTRGFLYVARLKNLEYLTLPLNLGDRDMGVIAVLPKLKGLYVFTSGDNRISNEGLRMVETRQSLEELIIGGGTMNDAGLAHVKGMSRLTYLSLWGDGFTGRGLAHLSASPTLRICDLSAIDNVTDETMVSLAAMPALEQLKLKGGPRLTDRGIALLGTSRTLRILDVSGGRMSAAGLAALAGIRTLEDLKLPESCLTDEGLATVGRMTQLKRLGMGLPGFPDRARYARYYSVKGLAEIEKLPQLEDLSVSGPAVTDESVDVIARCGGLKKLTITDAPLGNGGLVKLAALKSLEDLGLMRTQVTIGGMNGLGTLPRLKKLFLYDVPEGGPPLDLGGCPALEYLTLYSAKDSAVRDADMACLEKLTHLRSLQLSLAGASDEGLKHVAGLTELSNLIVTNSNNDPKLASHVTDAGLAHLSGLNRLISLTVAGNFNGSGLKHLQGLQTLNVVEVYSLREMDAKAVADLRRALPGATKYAVGKREVLPIKPVAATARGGV